MKFNPIPPTNSTPALIQLLSDSGHHNLYINESDFPALQEALDKVRPEGTKPTFRLFSKDGQAALEITVRDREYCLWKDIGSGYLMKWRKPKEFDFGPTSRCHSLFDLINLIVDPTIASEFERFNLVQATDEVRLQKGRYVICSTSTSGATVLHKTTQEKKIFGRGILEAVRWVNKKLASPTFRLLYSANGPTLEVTTHRGTEAISFSGTYYRSTHSFVSFATLANAISDLCEWEVAKAFQGWELTALGKSAARLKKGDVQVGAEDGTNAFIAQRGAPGLTTPVSGDILTVIQQVNAGLEKKPQPPHIRLEMISTVPHITASDYRIRKDSADWYVFQVKTLIGWHTQLSSKKLAPCFNEMLGRLGQEGWFPEGDFQLLEVGGRAVLECGQWRVRHLEDHKAGFKIYSRFSYSSDTTETLRKAVEYVVGGESPPVKEAEVAPPKFDLVLKDGETMLHVGDFVVRKSFGKYEVYRDGKVTLGFPTFAAAVNFCLPEESKERWPEIGLELKNANGIPRIETGSFSIGCWGVEKFFIYEGDTLLHQNMKLPEAVKLVSERLTPPPISETTKQVFKELTPELQRLITDAVRNTMKGARLS